jgi:CHAD domain-containing protein
VIEPSPASYGRDTSDEAHVVQIALLRKATIAQRFARVRSLTSSTIELSRRAIRRRLGDVDEREVLLVFVQLHYGRELAEALRADLDARDR